MEVKVIFWCNFTLLFILFSGMLFDLFTKVALIDLERYVILNPVTLDACPKLPTTLLKLIFVERHKFTMNSCCGGGNFWKRIRLRVLL